MKPRPLVAIFALAALSLMARAAEVRSAATAPNILVIVADDLGWADVGFHGKTKVTPNLDRLAREGTELQRFYVYPTCSPTRVALLTGQMPRRYGIVSALMGQAPGMPAGLVTIPASFKAAGYRTALIGKWHAGRATTPQQNGFEHFYGFLGSEIDYYTHTGKEGRRVDWQRDGVTLQEEGYSTDLFADEVVKQIRGRDQARPFYLQVSFNAPHVPLSAPSELLEKHKAEGRSASYSAVVEAMDTGIGRILAALDTERLRENTLVVFFSDNGAEKRDGGDNSPFSGGKFSVDEGGIHTPALIRWPGKVAAGAVLTQPISVHDLFPTLTAAAGLALPASVRIDGSNQWPAISEGRCIAREPFLIAASDIALIDGDWKLIELQDGRRSLFNLRDDVAERADLLAKRTDLATRLGTKLEALKKDLPAVTEQRGPGGGRGPRPGGPRPPGKPSSSTL